MRIIAATDGSTSAQMAIDVLRAFNWVAGTEIKLFSVARAPEFTLPFPASRTGGADQSQAHLEATKNAVKKLADEFQKSLPNCVVTSDVSQGDAKSLILDLAKEWTADLIVMGSRGNKGLNLILLGSVSQGVLMQSPCPLIIVKSEAPESLQKGFKTVLFAGDNSAYCRAAFDWLLGMRWGPDAKFVFTTVIPPLIDSIDPETVASRSQTAVSVDMHDSLKVSAQAELTKLADEFSARWGRDRVSTRVGTGDPRDVILNFASESSVDLIVMGSHGRTGLTKLFLGSVSQAVSLQAPCSVAIVRGVVPKGKGAMQQTGVFTRPKQ